MLVLVLMALPQLLALVAPSPRRYRQPLLLVLVLAVRSKSFPRRAAAVRQPQLVHLAQVHSMALPGPWGFAEAKKTANVV